MTQDEIIRMAIEAGIPLWDIGTEGARTASQTRKFNRLERFTALVADAKRKQTLCEAAAIVLMSPSREAAVDALQEMVK